MTAGGVVQVQQGRAHAVLPHGAYTVGEQQPPFRSFDGRTAIADDREFPPILGLHGDSALIPHVYVRGFEDIEVLAINAPGHHVAAANLAGKQSHPFVASQLSDQGVAFHGIPAVDFEEGRIGVQAVIGCIGSVVTVRAIVLREVHESEIFNAAGLVGRGREEHGLAQADTFRKMDPVVGAHDGEERFSGASHVGGGPRRGDARAP